MKKLKIAILGLAHVHAAGFVNCFRAYPDEAEVIGMADIPDPGNFPEETLEARLAHNMRTENPPPLFPSPQALLSAKPDIVCLASTIADHKPYALECLKRGIHTIIEKPMTLSWNDALSMYRAAQNSQAELFINWPVAWFPNYMKAVELAGRGEVGRILRVVYRTPATQGPYSSMTPFAPEKLKNGWCYRKECGGGSIVDYAGYSFSLATLFLKRAPKTVYGVCKNFLIPWSDVEDYSTFILDYGDAVAQAEGSWSTISSGDVPTGPVVYGSKGTIVCDRFSPEVKVYKKFKAYEKCQPPDSVLVPEEFAARFDLAGCVIDKLVSGKPVPEMISLDFNMTAQAAFSAGIRSCETGRIESVPVFEPVS